MITTRAIVAIAALAGCRVADLDVSGKPCPCPSDYVCDGATNTCAHSDGDAKHDDANPGAEASFDGVFGTSCLQIMPKTTLAYQTTTFSDFGSTWSTRGPGTWTITSGDAVQSDVGAMLALAQIAAPNGVNDYRIVSTFHATSTGVGKAIELAARSIVNLAALPPIQHLYHCNFEPTGGAFMIQRDDSPSVGTTLNITTIDTTAIPGYTESMPITMEFQMSGNSLACCIDNFPSNAYLAASDTMYVGGGVGIKTYEMTAVYDDFAVYH